jgi:hypothetical protein
VTRSKTLLALTLLFTLTACDPFGTDSGDDGGGCYSDGCDISGHVTTEAGNPLKDVKVVMTGGEGGYVVTDRNVYYSVSRNLMMRDYCVTPSKGPWEFEPDKRCYKDLAQNYTNQDFVAAHIDSFDITGYVIDRRAIPLKDVMMFLTGAAEQNVRTNAAGFYAFRSLRGREDYCVSPYKEAYTFEPTQRCYTYLDSLFEGENYLATEAE